MNIHEYQAKEVLRGFGVPVPQGFPAFSAEEAIDAAAKLGGPVWVAHHDNRPSSSEPISPPYAASLGIRCGYLLQVRV